MRFLRRIGSSKKRGQSLTEKIAMAAMNMNGSVLTLQRRILEQRLREEIREEAITEALKKTAEILAERLKELAEVLGGQAPMLRILIAIRKAAKVFDKKKPKPDLTNELGKLVGCERNAWQ